jgi:hypothetical protein
MRVTSSRRDPPQAAAVFVNELLTIAQDPVRFAEVIANVMS